MTNSENDNNDLDVCVTIILTFSLSIFSFMSGIITGGTLAAYWQTTNIVQNTTVISSIFGTYLLSKLSLNLPSLYVIITQMFLLGFGLMFYFICTIA